MGKKLLVGLVLVLVILPLLILTFGKSTGKVVKQTGTNDAISLVYIEGVISGGQSIGGLLSDQTAASETLMEQLRLAGEDPNTKVVLIRINSPGGSAPAAQEIGDQIDALRKQGKKVVVSMGDTAASGGYWLAAKADKIIANPATMTGSIGVIMETQNMQGLYDKLGIKNDPIKSAPMKDIGSSSRTMTPEERKVLQGMVDDIYNQFVEVVAKGRKMPVTKVRALADGRIFTGRQAKKLGLVDELGNFNYAIDYAGKMAGIKGRPALKEYGEQNPFNKLLGVSGTGRLDPAGLLKFNPLQLVPGQTATTGGIN